MKYVIKIIKCIYMYTYVSMNFSLDQKGLFLYGQVYKEPFEPPVVYNSIIRTDMALFIFI